jgi:hypothetical protein
MPPHYKSHYWLSLWDQYRETLKQASSVQRESCHSGNLLYHYISLMFAQVKLDRKTSDTIQMQRTVNRTGEEEDLFTEKKKKRIPNLARHFCCKYLIH